MPRRSRRARTSAWSQDVLVTVSAGNGVKAAGKNFSNWPSNCVISPTMVSITLAANEPAIFQAYIYDGENVQCGASAPVVVAGSRARTVNLNWPVSVDPLPPNWNQDRFLVEIQHICAKKTSSAVLIGTLRLSARVRSYEIPSSCPTFLGQFPLSHAHLGVNDHCDVVPRRFDCDRCAGSGSLEALKPPCISLFPLSGREADPITLSVGVKPDTPVKHASGGDGYPFKGSRSSSGSWVIE